jgi:hypothetical protein
LSDTVAVYGVETAMRVYAIGEAGLLTHDVLFVLLDARGVFLAQRVYIIVYSLDGFRAKQHCMCQQKINHWE